MRAFVTGATGYIGGSVAACLLAAGFQVWGLTRSQAGADKLKSLGIEPVIGDVSNSEILSEQARQADVVVNAASSDHRGAVEALLNALYGTNKVFIHTSGSTVVSDKANGEPGDKIFDESTKFTPEPEKQARVDIDNLVLAAGQKGVRSVVICPCLIYGEGLGAHKDSIQIPMLAAQAAKSGIARCVGRGENIWSTVHVADLADLYLLVAMGPPEPGIFLFAENGEITFRQIVQEIKTALQLSRFEEWAPEAAIAEWGFGGAVFALGSNSRIRGKRSRAIGWQPRHNDPLAYVRAVCAKPIAEPAAH